MIIVRTIGLWVDHPTTYYGYKKLAHTYKISKAHQIDVWDFAMEFAALTTHFGFYPDLKSIKYIKPKKAGKGKKYEPKEIEGDDEEGDTLEI